MNINKYRRLTSATLVSKEEPILDSLHFITGIGSELLTEFEEASTIANMGEELGDACWYMSEYCNLWNIKTPNRFTIATDTNLRVDRIPLLVGKLLDMDKAAFVYGRVIPFENRADVILELFATVQMLIEGIGLELDVVLSTNLKKLYERYKGKFTVYAANNRDLEAELEILEDNFGK